MTPFVERHQDDVGCVLPCFDRVVITGTLTDICHPEAMAGFLGYRNIKLFDYARWAEPVREELRADTERLAVEAGLQIEIHPSFRSISQGGPHSGHPRRARRPPGSGAYLLCHGRALLVSSLVRQGQRAHAAQGE
jgi:hypothetical protein